MSVIVSAEKSEVKKNDKPVKDETQLKTRSRKKA